MRKLWQDEAWEEYLYWQTQDNAYTLPSLYHIRFFSPISPPTVIRMRYHYITFFDKIRRIFTGNF